MLQDALNEVPRKLDDIDPLRRNYEDHSLEDNAKFIVSFGSKETSRNIFGKYKKSKASFSIRIVNRPEETTNSFNLYLPATETQFAEKIFPQILDTLNPMYAYADFQSRISAKRRADFFAVNFEQELPGVFWITFFCGTYVRYFDLTTFRGPAEVEMNDRSDGIALKLGKSPDELGPDIRRAAENLIGELSFVDPQSTTLKPIGKYVPSYDKF